ncbi:MULTISPECIES: VOC family protein [Burkholderia]|uniref:VOC family protein n=1 Tax=Burkholderia TaxID=32008 RepID=UPI000468DB54|nr:MULTISPECIES: VOC family protein [Burkholderia]MBU9320622.1 VOC family protein [Burkholderia gladioli]MCA8170586.1 VOC family protein [Burkholderia gladioli]NIF74709.1 VOC family protein [Burkholderia sp. Ap-962]
MQVQAYLFFGGRCDEAIAFYRDAIGAEVQMLMRHKDAPPNPGQPLDPALADKVMHASLRIGESQLMCSDGDCRPGAPQQTHDGYSLSLNPATLDEGRRIFEALASGGSVAMPFGPTFWALGFGMLRDRFGVHWMVNVEDPAARP